MKADKTRAALCIGIDEVGRGALAGPVVVAAVRFDSRTFPPEILAGLDDSKKLRPAERTRLAALIRAHAEVSVAAASARVIDRVNIRRATLLAMARAAQKLRGGPVFVDGVDVPDGIPVAEAVVRGDATVPQIAAASIVAKVLRDRLMAKLGARSPYKHEDHAGYGTPAHLAAIRRFGLSPHHRRSFTRGFQQGAFALDPTDNPAERPNGRQAADAD